MRDRKRAETRARIEAAAVELVLSGGLEAATVDAISERADVSPRTFFNYFETKDAAVLGMRPSAADEEVMAEQLEVVDDLDPVVAVVRLVMATMGVAESVAAGLHRSRLEILRRHPEIAAGQFAQLTARKDRLAEYVGQILSRRSPPADDTDADARTRGDIVLSACASAVRSAVLRWANDPASGEPGPDGVELIEQRAAAFVHSTLRRLT
jgi:AcrR family transcriptional regulator